MGSRRRGSAFTAPVPLAPPPLRSNLFMNQQLKSRVPTPVLASLESLTRDDPVTACSQLDSIKIEPNDFPWLADILTCHKARAYWKAGRETEEVRERSIFLESQQMLFEPEHAESFALLDYQEKLKSIYQNDEASEALTAEKEEDPDRL